MAAAPATIRALPARARLDERVATVIGALAMAATAAVVAVAPDLGDALVTSPRQVAALLLLTLVLQMASVRVYGRGTVSVSAVGILVAVYTLPAGAAMAIAGTVAFAQWMRTRPAAYKGLFDISNYVVSTAAAAAAFHLVPAGRGVAAVAAGIVYAAVNNGMLCVVWSLAEQSPIRVLWLERFHWARFHFAIFGVLAYAGTVAYEQVGELGLAAFALPPALVMLSIRQYLDKTAAAVEEAREAHERLRRSHRDTIAALSRSIEAKDYYTGGHTERVAAVAVGLANRLGYSGSDLDAIEIGALLHDIGKIGIPETILKKEGPLTDEEWVVMREHPVISDMILAELDLNPVVRQCARSSHERIDGAGYPDSLAGDNIPLPARIVFVADAYDALTSDRPYRRGRPPDAALAEIAAHAGTQFCPTVVAALREIWVTNPHVLMGTQDDLAARTAASIPTVANRPGSKDGHADGDDAATQ